MAIPTVRVLRTPRGFCSRGGLTIAAILEQRVPQEFKPGVRGGLW